MSELIPRQSTDLANVDAILAQRAAAILDNVKAGGKYISLNNRQFNMPGGEVINGTLDLVILDYAFHFRYYPDPYQQGQNKPAACYAIGDAEDSMVIGADVPHPIHSECNTCPNNQWGSVGGGRKGKACSNTIMFAVMLPDLGESTDVMIIKASPAGLSGCKQFLTNATRLYGHPLKALATATIVPAGGAYKLVLEVSGENPSYQEHAKYLDVARDAVRTPPTVGVPDVEIPFDSKKKVARS